MGRLLVDVSDDGGGSGGQQMSGLTFMYDTFESYWEYIKLVGVSRRGKAHE